MKTMASPDTGRSRLKARIEAARRSTALEPSPDEEFRRDVVAAREEYRAALRQGLAPRPSEPEEWDDTTVIVEGVFVERVPAGHERVSHA